MRLLHEDGYWYTNNTATFVMPAADVIVQGIFTDTSTGENEIAQMIPDTGEVELKLAGSVKKFKVYSSGGKAGGYGNNASGYLLLTAPEDYVISLSGTVTTESNGIDYLRIFDGNTTLAQQLGSKEKYGNSSGDTVEYLTSSSNQILLYFYSDNSKALQGVDLTVTMGSVNEEYNIMVADHENGKVEVFAGADATVSAKGKETVTVVGTPKDGYDLTGIQVTDSLGQTVVVTGGFWYTDNTATFVMPAMDVSVECIFTDTSTGENEISETIPDSGMKELKIAKDVKSFKIYSSGGKTGGYGNNAAGYLLLTAPENFIMKLSGTCVTENISADYLVVYDGSEAAESAIIGNQSKYGSQYGETVETIVSSTNQMLLYFGSDLSNCESGVDLTVVLSDLSQKYAIEANAPINGTVIYSVDGNKVDAAAEFETVAVTATPSEGYMLTGLCVYDEEERSLEVTGGSWRTGNVGTFLMPEGKVTVCPQFALMEDIKDEMYQNIPATGSLNIDIPREIRSFQLYDDGGSNGDYSCNCNSYVYLTAPEGYLIQIEGSVWTENTHDYLRIYDGEAIADDKMLGQSFMGTSGVNTGTLTSTGNKMSLYFHSDTSNVNTGFSLTVQLVPITYALSYDMGDGEMKAGETNPATYTADDVIALNQPVLEGYLFGGWTGTGLSEATVDVTIPIGSYGDRTYTATWRKLLTHKDVVVEVSDQSYNGMFEDPVTVKDADELLERNKDYSVIYRSGTKETEYPVQAGTYEVIISGLGDYAGTVEKVFIIEHVLLDLVSLTATDRVYDKTNQIYFSEAILSGIVDTDDVRVDIEAMCGTVSSADCGEYEEVTFDMVPLAGEDAQNYVVLHPGNPYKLNKAVTIYKAQNARMQNSSLTVQYQTKTVGQIVLPQDWYWQPSDVAKELIVGETVTATAIYDGADKDNYENLTEVVSITRRACTHSWGEGAVTTHPTAVAKGIKTYTCSICNGKKTEDIAALGLPKKGATAVDAKTGLQYKVTKSAVSGGTVEISKPTNKKMTSVKVPDAVMIDGVTYKVTSIANNAFSGCKKLKKVTIGKNVTTIGKNAFRKCTNLKTVTIHSKVLKKIGANAFFGDKKLTKITLKTTLLTKKSVGKNVLKGTSKKLVIKVPKQKLKAYKAYFRNKGNAKVKVK